ncbi:MAG: hypothetical protein Q9185_003042 [Variospora sp. 1 TL-2023]
MEGQSKLLDFNKHAETLLDFPAQFHSGKERVENAMLDKKYCNGNTTSTAVWDDNMASPMHTSLSEKQRLPKLNGCGDRDSPASLTGTDADADIANIPARIAICGMAVRLPNGIKTPQQLWQFLLNKGDARSRVPESRYNVSAFYHPSGKPGTVITEHGYFLDDDIGTLDTSFFSMPRMELERADPQQRLLLEITRECLEDAGITKWRGRRIGCYVGSLGEDWSEMFARESQNWGMYRASGSGDFALSNRVSYEMDFRGPRGDCDGAIVGGVNLIMTPGATMSMTEQNVLSSDGSCKSFSAEANGYARGEAITAVFITSLDRALRDGNPVRAVIRGTATNHDGKTPGMSFPSTDAQEALMKRAYHVAGINDVSQTGYVECHGTGTPIGDPVETKAVARVFGGLGVHIGSIKPNLGHTEGASGLLSVIKTVLALENATIPPNIKFLTPNPAIPFTSGKLMVPTDPTPWPNDRLKRASVNSFGVGGSNAHAILDCASYHDKKPLCTPSCLGPSLLLFSANSTKALETSVASYQDFIEKNPSCIPDLAYTLANRREHLSYRAFSISDQGIMGATSTPTKSGRAPELVMVFTGQGAQWSQMGLELLDSDPIFLDTIRQLDRYLQCVFNKIPQWTLEGQLRQPGNKGRLDAAELAQPLTTAIQIALVDALASKGMCPAAVVGHSSGEIAGAYAAGAITAKEAILIAMYRGVAATMQTKPGAMAAIGLSWGETENYLVPNVGIACDNSPNSVTISGDADAVETVITRIRNSGTNILARKLQVDKAYHSHHMAEVGDHYHSLLVNCVGEKRATKLFFSSVTGGPVDFGLGPKYWQKNMESPVLFQSAVSHILRHRIGANAVFLEVGPHSALAGPLRQILAHGGSKASYVSTMVRYRDCSETFLSALGSLWSLQVPLALEALFPSGSCLTDLPPYPWDHEESYWYESRLSKEFRHRKYPHCDLLGSRVLESTDLEPSWRNVFHLDNTPWIRDHKVESDLVFPFAGYIAMAGEAIRQIDGTNADGFRLRRILVSTALILSDDKTTEMITTLRRQRLTDTLDSQWWEFSISSHNGRAWTKHCTGETAIYSDHLTSLDPPQTFTRKISMRKWFHTLQRAGLDLGPAFQSLEDVSAATTTQQATGTVRNESLDTDRYHLHPTAVDAALQLVGVAFTSGEPRKHKTRLPTTCDEILISRYPHDFAVEAAAKVHGSSVIGDIRGFADGKTVLRISGLKLASIDSGDGSMTENTHAAARQIWSPDVDFMNTDLMIKLIKPYPTLDLALEELTDLCVLTIRNQLAGTPPGSGNVLGFRQFIDQEVQLMDTTRFKASTYDSRLDSLVQDLASTEASSVAHVLKSITQKSTNPGGPPLSWRKDLPSEMIRSFYQFIDRYDISEFLQRVAHNKPNLRVLEISSWTDSPSESVLESLTLADGHMMCSKYTLMTRNYISAAQKESSRPYLEYITFNLDEDPSDHGFGQYDLIITNYSIYGSADLQSTLINIRKLLNPQGHLLLREPCTAPRWMTFVFGTNPHWWSQENHGDLLESRSNPARWHRELLAAGFEGMDLSDLDVGYTRGVDRPMILRPVFQPYRAKQVTLLCEDRHNSSLLQALNEKGCEVTQCTLQNCFQPSSDVIALLDEDEPFFETLNGHSYEALQNFLKTLGNAGVLWITRPCQMSCRDPRYAQVIGAARTIRSELLVDFATCEVDSLDSSVDQIVQVFEKFQNRKTGDILRPELEYAIHDGTVYINRFFPFSLADELLIAEPGDRAMLDIAVPGRLGSLHWVRRAPVAELKPDEVEIEIHAVGLNFRDILIALQIVELDERPFGCEGAGIVRRVGSEVRSLAIGDRVAVIDRKTFSTSHITREILCVKIPDSLSFDEASAMFFPYATAMHSLMTIGNLEKGQSVLIHSACGGVGLAAINLAQMIGAEIYATVGSEDKVQHLVQHCNIPPHRIFNSRDDGFVAGIMRETGQGVDMVLNSLSGDLLHATWRCVAPFGKMIEIGKRDLIGFGKLDMNTFLANRSYCCVDVDMFLQKPAILNRMERMTVDFLERGLITPIRPLKVFDAASTNNAFRYMQPGQHIGRIAVSLRDSPETTKLGTDIKNRPREICLQESASYLLVGGLGGLGRSVSRWMVEHGARHLIYLSRSAGSSPDDTQFIKELNSMGCSARLVRGTVTSLADVTTALHNAEKNPVRGILQMSMVLRDQNFTTMTWSEWQEATAPKVQGTWNLHNASISGKLDLDFFVAFSSLSGIIGQPGQANYASANTFLDAFVKYRKSLGLQASALDIGAVEDVGYISEDGDLMQKMTTAGFKAVKEQEVLDALRLAMGPPHHPITNEDVEQDGTTPGLLFGNQDSFVLGLESTTPLDNPANRAVWKTDRRMAIYHNNTTSEKAADAQQIGLKAYIAKAKLDPSMLLKKDHHHGDAPKHYFAKEVGKKLMGLLMKEAEDEEEINLSLSLTDLGMDSLVGIELCNWWKQVFGFKISVLEMLGMGSLEAVGEYAVEGLLKMVVVVGGKAG